MNNQKMPMFNYVGIFCIYSFFIIHWRVTEIQNVLIPLLDFDLQMLISVKVQESFILRSESERLLNLAKHAVGIAIEQGEAAGFDLITKNQ